MELYDKILIAADIIAAALLIIADNTSRRVMSSKWRLCWCLPMLLCMALIALAGFDKYMLPAYTGAFVMAAGLFRDGKNLRRAISGAGATLACISIPLCLCCGGYRQPDYVKDFETGFAAMKEHYVLGEHKNIDWDELYTKYLPSFTEANREHDPVSNLIAWETFCGEFYDGHVGFSPDNQEYIDLANERVCGNDYGLSLMTMADGRTAAVCVEEGSEACNAGIRNGTVITSWDGMSIREAAERSQMRYVFTFPDKDNEAFYIDMFAAGVGGDTVNVTFMDENGIEQSVSLHASGSYYDRAKKTMDTVNRGLEAGHMSWTAINDNTAVLRIKTMMYDSDSYVSEDHSAMKNELRSRALEFREKGYDNLIIDIRENNGGSGTMVMAIAEVFAPEGTHYYCSEGKWDDGIMGYMKDPDTGGYVTGKDHYYIGENVWDGGRIILLVNAYSVSAADHLTSVCQSLDNVTVMGFTEPNGSAQAVKGVPLESGFLSFSSCLMLNSDGSVFIDPGEDRESGNGIDIQVPFDENAVRVLFDEDGDYVMQKALELLGE